VTRKPTPEQVAAVIDTVLQGDPRGAAALAISFDNQNNPIEDEKEKHVDTDE